MSDYSRDKYMRCVVQGPEHTDVGLVCQEMALLMERTKRLPQARDLLQRGLDIRAVSCHYHPLCMQSLPMSSAAALQSFAFVLMLLWQMPSKQLR